MRGTAGEPVWGKPRSSHAREPCSETREATTSSSLRTPAREEPRSRGEEAWPQQRRPSAAETKAHKVLEMTAARYVS